MAGRIQLVFLTEASLDIVQKIQVSLNLKMTVFLPGTFPKLRIWPQHVSYHSGEACCELLSATLFSTLLRFILPSTFTVSECQKQATVDGLLLTTFGDGGRGQVLSTVDRRLFITLSIRLGLYSPEREERLGATCALVALSRPAAYVSAQYLFIVWLVGWLV